MASDSNQKSERSGGERSFDGTPYRFAGKLGQGGMGMVYLVEHRETGALCVAKVIHRHLVPDAQVMDRFRLEAQSLGRLEHPHVVEVLGAGNTADGRPYIVLEYLKGMTLSDRLLDGPMSKETTLQLARQFLSALEAAHEFGIVHRDFKPANIFLAEKTDGTAAVKVLDFGLAKVLPSAPTEAPAPLADPTTAGTVVGTPRYMSPEAAQGVPIDQRADVYAAALVIYKMLAGRGPFDHHPQGERQMAAHVIEAPPPLSNWIKVAPRLEEVIMRALAKDPKRRYSSAREFSLALHGALEASTKRRETARDNNGKVANPSALRNSSTGRVARVFILAVVIGAVIMAFVKCHFAG